MLQGKQLKKTLLNIVENKETSEFYPTPKSIIDKMLAGVEWGRMKSILEPSAGKGDILRELAIKEFSGHYYRNYNFDVDCIEIDPNLRQILKYNFSDERKKELNEKQSKIRRKYKYCEERGGKWVYYNNELNKYVPLPKNDNDELDKLEEEKNHFFDKGLHIVHDDFLTYEPFKQYDLIIMNPPFSNGDLHLLKALEFQKNGGNIICLLNAETIKNPYTERRKELVKKLKEYNAIIEYISDGFLNAERTARVEVALIKVAIEQVQEESEIYNRFKEAEKVDDFQPENTELEVTDYIKAAVNQYKVEVQSGIELIRQYRALVPYMTVRFGEDKYDKKPILRLIDSDDRLYDSVSINDYLKCVRRKYWRALLSNEKYIGKLTSKLRSEYQDRIEKLSDYDFSEFNIYTLSAELNTHIKSGIEDEIIAMYDRLTEEHSWYPETQKNRHYYDGWATNKAHKIDKKVIIPCHGIFDSWDGRPRIYNAENLLYDIEKILNFLDGNMTEEINLNRTLDLYFSQGITKKVPLKYFDATFYKKGTIHLEFKCPELIERFNIYAGQRKAWLPPSYGKKQYADMTAEEKVVVDTFQGEKSYNEILEKSNYYLAPVTNNQTLLLEGEVN